MLSINSSNVIEFNGLQNGLTNDYVNSAVVTITIYDSKGDELTGVVWPQALLYVATSDGIYRETFAPFTDMIENELYEIVYSITADGLELECARQDKAERGGCC